MAHHLWTNAYLETTLHKLEQPWPTGRVEVYRISDPLQVVERCRSMFRRARRKVFAVFSQHLATTAGRGVEVNAKVCESNELEEEP